MNKAKTYSIIALIVLLTIFFSILYTITFMHENRHIEICEKYGYTVKEVLITPFLYGFVTCTLENDINTSRYFNETYEHELDYMFLQDYEYLEHVKNLSDENK